MFIPSLIFLPASLPGRVIGWDLNKERFKKWQLCGVWNRPFCTYRAMKVMNCVC